MEGLQTFTATALLVLTIITAQDLVRYLKARDWNGAIAIVASVVIGIGVAFLAAQADVAEKLQLVDGAKSLGDLNSASLVMLGVGLGAAAPQLVQARKAIDRSDSACTPTIVGSQEPAE